jgi:hypothetical protein
VTFLVRKIRQRHVCVAGMGSHAFCSSNHFLMADLVIGTLQAVETLASSSLYFWRAWAS